MDDEELKKICIDPIFQEAVYLASPYVYNEIVRWLDLEKKYSSEKFQKLKDTILKYYSRTSTRCTPFGLFSEVGIGRFNSAQELNYNSSLEKLRDTKLDMHFLIGLTQQFLKRPEIRNQILFYPNNSIYKVGRRIRYIEYEHTKEKREYIISSVLLSSELQKVLDFCISGRTIQQIAFLLTDKEVSQNEAEEFIEELIDNQILVSELEPNVSGHDFLHTILSVLHKVKAQKEIDNLSLIQDGLNNLDKQIGNPIIFYREVEKVIQDFNVEYKPNHLFQTDLFYKDTLGISSIWKKELKKGVCFLNKITSRQKGTHLEEFKKAFNERFETREVPLAYALDTEVGIGYRQDYTAKGIHPYIDDLEIPLTKEKIHLKVDFDPFHQLLNEKLQEALLSNSYKVELYDDDLKNFEENWDDLPDTISLMTEVISENSQLKLCINSCGSGAANLLARFCSEKSNVHKLTKKIAQKEEELKSDYILAEIIHLPEARIGNVIRRPTLRPYEIPYLAKSILPDQNQIPVDDLFISLKNDKIILRSRKLDKEVRPYLTNAHNYSANSLPVYHFLCDLSSQNSRAGMFLNWGDIKYIYQFLPRIEYKNIIFSKASWKITDKEIIWFLSMINEKERFLSALENWRKSRQIPQWIQWVKSDNRLTVNLENYDLAKMLFNSVAHEELIFIEEFLYNENDDFKREFIFPLYKDNQ
ncbi:lantibiotic dehydratase family protein [Chryseobacterium flavum]|nr:lantibiotic dehydratase family protein [Chryseobacterium flavum]